MLVNSISHPNNRILPPIGIKHITINPHVLHTHNDESVKRLV